MEREIIRKIREGDQMLRDEFIKKHQGLVVSIARKYAHSPEVLSDLIAEGNLGLIKAIEKFDLDKGVKFSTYAYYWIKRFIVNAIRRHYEVLRKPENYYIVKEKLDKVNNDYNLKYGRDATDEELARELKISLPLIKKLRKYAKQVTTISSSYYNEEEEGVDVFDFVDVQEEDKVDEVLMDRDTLSTLFEKLKQRESRANIEVWYKVLALYFGLEDGVRYNHREIGEKLGITSQRVCQIKHLCLRRLRRIWEEMKKERR